MLGIAIAGLLGASSGNSILDQAPSHLDLPAVTLRCGDRAELRRMSVPWFLLHQPVFVAAASESDLSPEESGGVGWVLGEPAFSPATTLSSGPQPSGSYLGRLAHAGGLAAKLSEVACRLSRTTRLTPTSRAPRAPSLFFTLTLGTCAG
jgi:hypothetical protein